MKKMLLNFRDRMFRLSDDEPLSPLSVFVLILLDIFLLTVLFQGLNAQSRLLTTPDEYVPYICQRIIIHRDWTENNRLDKLSDIVIGYHRSTYREESPSKVDPLCKEVLDAINRVKTDQAVTQLFEERDQLITLQDDIEKSLKDVGSLAEVRNNPRYIGLANEILGINQKINSNPKVTNLWSIIAKASAQQEAVIKTLRNYRFIFPIYEVLLQFLFLLPLLVIFYIWYKKSVNNRFQSLISTHLLIVVSIPIFLKIIKLILNIIPEQIIKNFIDLLDSLKLIAIWYYIVIAIAIGVAVLLIYLLQKHLFNREKIIGKRIRNRNCVGCGKKLPVNDEHCFECGTGQYQVCPECGRLTYVNSKYCRVCGKRI
ncbi:MAG: zinc ribbon domain-containing protein [Firmicutes bacterium]|nr:zinc ribbon domain-containing protein [Bacillota bacterium]